MNDKESLIEYSNAVVKLSKLDDELKKYKNPIIIGEKNKLIDVTKSNNYITIISEIKSTLESLTTKYASFIDDSLQKYINSIKKEINLSNKIGGLPKKNKIKDDTKKNRKTIKIHTKKKRI